MHHEASTLGVGYWILDIYSLNADRSFGHCQVKMEGDLTACAAPVSVRKPETVFLLPDYGLITTNKAPVINARTHQMYAYREYM